MSSKWLGVDVGGANIKVANDTTGLSLPFQLWKKPEELSSELRDIFCRLGEFDHLAVTMTGELADCFESRKLGVEFICDAVVSASPISTPIFYQTSGQFVSVEQAKQNWMLTAASNWHATASYCGKRIRDCIVIDIGSTTTDIIPVVNGTVATVGRTDLTRSQNDELVYTGVIRTPVCAVSDSVRIQNHDTRLAAEFFATMQDVYVVLGKLREGDSTCHTADGRPATKACAARRLCKMICTDESELSEPEIISIAEQFALRQMSLIKKCITAVSKRNPGLEKFLVVGEGAWLAREILQKMGKGSNQVTGLDQFVDSKIDVERLCEIGPAFAMLHLAKSHARIST